MLSRVTLKLELIKFQKIRETEPKGPYTIVGYSAGTFVAIELGLKFQETHEVCTYATSS